ncbi:MAG: UDP-N-acetylglucosamine 2-epimerase (hydrolyzing) [Rhodospirillaceae bacterium]|nr:UDP-N-acetylglucosamine 2-epimerase (hydrolyzing) [Rhodospirillaceae bacterium]
MTIVLSVSSSRADVGILAPVWYLLAAEPDVELHIFLTGAHVSNAASAAGAVPDAAEVHRGGADLAGRAAPEAAAAVPEIAAAMVRLIDQIGPDSVLVIGDRLDMLPAAMATLAYNLPLIHLHGGESSEGAVDERIRHAISKLAHLHCAASVDAATRLNRMGEEAWRIHVTGAPGLDSLLAAPQLSADELAAELGLAAGDNFILATVHPETNVSHPFGPLDAVLAALDAAPRATVITAPNADPGGAEMRTRIEDFAAARPWVLFCDTLGARLYANAMRHAAVMLGNSSSGIVEAGLFGLPVINVGGRQEGRACGANVHHCSADADAVGSLLAQMCDAPSVPRAARVSLYGDGQAAPRIVEVIKNQPAREKLLVKRYSDQAAEFSPPWAEHAAA